MILNIAKQNISIYATRNQKSKMVYDVKELKEYFDKRFNELKNSLCVNYNTLENFKNEIKSDF